MSVAVKSDLIVDQTVVIVQMKEFLHKHTFVSDSDWCFNNIKNNKRLTPLERETPSVINLRWPKSVTAISICSRKNQRGHGNFNLATANFNLTTANFNLLTVISICSRQFQLGHDNFNLATAISISIYSYSLLLECMPNAAEANRTSRTIYYVDNGVS